MPDTIIRNNAKVRYSIIGESADIGVNSKVGDNPEYYSKLDWEITVIGKGKKVEQNCTILPKEIF